MMATSANAGTISYTTNSPLTEFVAGINNLTLHSILGQAGTLTFVPNTSSTSGVPSNIDLGDFLLACPTCTTNQTTVFGAFTFDLIVTDTTDTATGEFIGMSTGGIVSSTSSISGSSLIVAPNSGTPPGDATIQAQVSSAPESATFGMIGVALLACGLFRR